MNLISCHSGAALSRSYLRERCPRGYGLILVIAFPQIALWFPDWLFGP